MKKTAKDPLGPQDNPDEMDRPKADRKESVTDRVEARLLNPTPEDEARFQEYIANN